MPKIIAIANQKGGVGKTTTAVNFAAALTRLQKKILLIDLDSQGNATTGCGIQKQNLRLSISDALLAEADFAQVCQALPAEGFDLLPANQKLTATNVLLGDLAAPEQALRNFLAPVALYYDYILIDCPPALNLLTINAFVAADGILVPMQCEYYALEGVADLLRTVEQLRQQLQPNLAIIGVLRTLFDSRNNLAQQVSEQLGECFGSRLYQTVIPRNVRLAEAPSHGQSIFLYDAKSRGAESYLALAYEFLGEAVDLPAENATKATEEK
jgi:chromosome partitioning protein